jgi:hypothetical protein
MRKEKDGSLGMITSFSAFDIPTSPPQSSLSFTHLFILQNLSMVTISIMSADDQAFLDIVSS